MDLREIQKIQFGILSPEEIRSMAVCKIDSTKLSGPGSVYDDRMGIISETSENCITCGLGARECPGHFGYIELNEYILHPLYHKMVSAFLQCFCKNCYRLIIHPDQLQLWGIAKLKGERKFLKVLEHLAKVDICFHCHSPQPAVINKVKEGIILLEYKEKVKIDDEEKANTLTRSKNKTTKISIVLSVEEIKKIFDNVSNQDVEVLGFNPKLVHPKNLIMTVFPVLPPTARPYIMTGSNVCDDDLTIHIAEIVKDNLKLQKCQEEGNDQKKRQKLVNSLKFHISTFYNNSKGRAKHPTDNQPIKGLKERLAGKEGQLRQNHMGKRVDFSGRTVIGPDPTLRMDEMAIPIEIAQKLTIPERVTTFNIDKLTEIVNNNQANFVIRNNGKTCINLKYAMFRRGTELLYGDIIVIDPTLTLYEELNGKIGIPKKGIIKVKTGNEPFLPGYRLIRNGKLLDEVKYPTRKNFELKVGDVVERHLRNGDWVLLNRQPTLHQGSMMAMKVVVRPYKTIRINLAVTRSFNADE